MLDHETQLPRRLHVVRGYVANAFNLHRVGIYLSAERQFGQNFELLRGVVAIDIEGGISFRETFCLRFAKRIVEFNSTFSHARQNVIAGAVQNPAEPLNTISDQSISESANNRNAAANAGFKPEADSLRFRRLHQTKAI